MKKVGRRKISETINKILMKQLFTSDKSMFGVDPWLTIEGLRDEEKPHESIRVDRVLYGFEKRS